jgi:hypothetical protein
MDQWSALGSFMLGAAVGALLTRIVYAGRIRKLRRLMDSRETCSQRAQNPKRSSNPCKHVLSESRPDLRSR